MGNSKAQGSPTEDTPKPTRTVTGTFVDHDDGTSTFVPDEQDDKQLREAVATELMEHGAYPQHEELAEALIDSLVALFQKEQIQLVSELMEQAIGKAVGVPCVRLEVLEHKKQELERGQ